MGKKMFQPEKYGMTLCPGVMAREIFQKRQPCPECGGFKSIKKEKKDPNPSRNNDGEG